MTTFVVCKIMPDSLHNDIKCKKPTCKFIQVGFVVLMVILLLVMGFRLAVVMGCIAAIGIIAIGFGFRLILIDIHIAAESAERNLAAAIAGDTGITLDHNFKIGGKTAG